MLVKEKYESLSSDITRAFIIVEFVSTLSWGLILPTIAKLQGLYWAAGAIAGYYIAHQIGQIVMPYLKKKFNLGALYRAIITLDVLYLASMGLYLIDVKAFLAAEATLMVLYRTIMVAFEIKFNATISKKYGEKEYENAATVEKSVSAVAAIIGYLIIAILDTLNTPTEFSIGVFAAALTVNLVFRFRYHAKVLELEAANL